VWRMFYTLMVLATALFDKPAFQNLICNGLVLAEDEKKMSKHLKNYPPPTDIIDEYGADALRLYLINSPVVKGEPLRFKKDGVYAVVKDVFLPWYNAYRFLVQNVLRLEVEGLAPFRPMDFSTLQKSTNALDRWINSASQSLVFFVRQEMEAYRLYTVSIIECKNQIIPYPRWWLLLSCPGYCLIWLTSERLGTGGSFPA
jgi:isoleucyl-tRNA synthetase